MRLDPSIPLKLATLIAINSADDQRNRPELAVMEPAIQRISTAQYILLRRSRLARAWNPTANARLYKQHIAELMAGPAK